MAVDVPYLAHCEVFDEEGKSHKVASLWAKQTTVFIFLRHFACIECRTHAVNLWNKRQQYESTGARLVFIGNGAPHFIKYFKEELKIFYAPIFTDPKLQTFRAAGFKRGFLAALGPSSIARGLKLYKDGGRQGTNYKDSGDLWQMGGVLVVRPDGSVAYHYISEMLGDFPPDNDVVRASGT